MPINEAKKRRECRDMVIEEVRKLETDLGQRSRQLWHKEGDTRFFHLTENGSRRSNKILKVQVEKSRICWNSCSW